MDLPHLTLQQASDLLHKKEISSVELTESCLKRIEEVEPRIKSFVTITSDFALKQAQAADERLRIGEVSPLTGIPTQIKDVMCTKDIRTTCSSRMLEEFIPTYNATVVEKLYENGAVLIGKGNMDEFAMGSSTENSAFFTTRNPWDLDRVPGGSSGGGAAAVAASETLFALGSDTGGSIRQPASLCGIVGLKPTYGLVSRYGLVAFASSLDQIGPMTRDVVDMALVLNAIVGHDPRDSTSIPNKNMDYTQSFNKDINGLRLGVPKEYFAEGIDPKIEETLRTFLRVMEGLGATVEETSLPSTRYALACYYIIAPSECSTNLARYDGVKFGFSYQDTDNMWEAMEKTRQIGFGPEVKRRIMLGTYALSAGYYDAYYLKALQVRTIIREELQEAFKHFDALVTPTSPTVAFRIGERTTDPVQMYLSDICTIPANIAGTPAISVPAGFINNLPVGIQLMGKALGEETLLRLAHAYQQTTEWHKISPPI